MPTIMALEGLRGTEQAEGILIGLVRKSCLKDIDWYTWATDAARPMLTELVHGQTRMS